MRTRAGIAIICGGLTAAACQARHATAHQTDFQALIAAHRWFELRDAVTAQDTPAYARGVAEFAFNQPQTESDLRAALAADPNVATAKEIRSRLFQLYFRQGRYRDALDQIEARARVDPNADDVRNARALLAPLAHVQDFSVDHRQPSSVPLGFLEGNMVLPIEINGRPAHYIFDCGANISVISESEAARAGLHVLESQGKMVGMTGTASHVRVAVADTLRVGNVTMRNVVFTVNPDNMPPFNDWPKDHGGILGIQVAMALGNLQWSPSGAVTIAAPSAATSAESPNMAFDDNWPVTQVRFQGTTLAVTLDTGAQETVLYPPFAAAFPELMKQGKKDEQQLSGFSGNADVASLAFPSLSFEMAGRTVVLAPAEVLLRQTMGLSRWYAGNFGMDLINQASAVSLDFQAMRFSLK